MCHSGRGAAGKAGGVSMGPPSAVSLMSCSGWGALQSACVSHPRGPLHGQSPAPQWTLSEPRIDHTGIVWNGF